MKFLQGKLDNPSTPLNIRLFIAKLIINAEEVLLQRVLFASLWIYCMLCIWCFIWHLYVQIFHPYAKHWLGPLVQLVVSSSNGGEGIHFMVVDIVVTVLSWASVATPKVCMRCIFTHVLISEYIICKKNVCIPYILTYCLFIALFFLLFRVAQEMRFWPIGSLGFWLRTASTPNGLFSATTWRSSAQLWNAGRTASNTLWGKKTNRSKYFIIY